MSALILPRRLSAQPQYAAQVDRGNPTTSGLVNLYLRGFDAVQNRLVPASDASQLIGTPAGMAASFSGSNYVSLGTALGSTGSMSYVAQFCSTALGGGQNDIIALGDRCTLRIDSGTGRIEAYTYNGGGWDQVNSSTFVPQGTVATVVFTHSAASGNNLYVAFAGSFSADTASASARSTGSHDLRIGLDDETARSLVGWVSMAGAFTRELSPGEAGVLARNPWQLFRAPARRLWAATATADVTLALTAVTGTGSVGSIGVAHAQALTGTTGTGSVGSVSPALSKALTGNSGTGSVGTVVPNLVVALTGVTGTGSVGTVSPSQQGTAALTAVTGTGSAGNVGPAASLAPSGTTATGSVGTVASTSSAGLTGSTGTGSAGSVGANVSVALSGISATGTVGSVTVLSADVTIALTGVSASGSVGAVVANGGDLPRVSDASGGFPDMPRRSGQKYKEWVQQQRIALGIVEPDAAAGNSIPRPEVVGAQVVNELRAFRGLAKSYQAQIEQRQQADIGEKRKAREIARIQSQMDSARAHAETLARQIEEADVIYVARILARA